MTGKLIVTLVCLSLSGFAFVLFPSILQAADAARIELHPFQTVTLSDQEFLTGKKDGKSVIIAGELRLPRRGTDRLPAMVIVHGSGGVLGQDDRWARELNELGIAAFILDAFTGRGIGDTVSDQTQLGVLTMINDAYRAFDLLAKHPRIDPTRVGIMGGSRGGAAALHASVRRFQRMHGTSGLEFAVYLPFHAVCYARYIGDEDVSDKPIRLFHGAADDIASAAHCQAYVDRLGQARKDVRLTVYADAHHLFDNPVLPITYLPQTLSVVRCRMEERPAGQIVNVETGRVRSVSDPCFGRGGTIGYNATAHAQAVTSVREILRTTFNLPGN